VAACVPNSSSVPGEALNGRSSGRGSMLWWVGSELAVVLEVVLLIACVAWDMVLFNFSPRLEAADFVESEGMVGGCGLWIWLGSW